MNFAIIRAKRDSAEIQNLSELCRLIHGKDTAPDIDYWSRQGHQCHVIIADGQSIGAVVFKPHTSMATLYAIEAAPSKASLYLCYIGIIPPWRGKGFASLTMRWVHAVARCEGYARIVSNVRLSNLPSINLHRSCGYNTTGTQRGYYSDNDEDALVMERVIATRT